MLRYVAISMGEPTGTAVEMIIKTVNSSPFGNYRGIIVVGDKGVFKKVATDLMLPLNFSSYVDSEVELKKAEEKGEQYIFYSSSSMDLTKFEYGKVSKESGEASYLSLERATELIVNGYAYTLVTAAISTDAITLAGHEEKIISQLLKKFAASDRAVDMLKNGNANAFLLSHRRSLRSALERVSEENLMDRLITIDGLFVSEFFDRSKPIAVACMNPITNDGNWTGPEEREIIVPAIETARRIGINVIGPIPSEELYQNAKKGEYSAILSLFRNEAYAALSDPSTVLITWGLPFIRVGVTVDSELDKAGKNRADIINMQKALDVAVKISEKGVWV